MKKFENAFLQKQTRAISKRMQQVLDGYNDYMSKNCRLLDHDKLMKMHEKSAATAESELRDLSYLASDSFLW